MRKIAGATERAIKLVKEKKATRYEAARICGIALSTIYRAMPELNKSKSAPIFPAQVEG